MLTHVRVTVPTTGSAGSATGTAYSDRPVNGEIRAVRVNWDAAAPGTSVIAVTLEADDQHPAVTLYAKSTANSDINVYPKVQNTDTAGAAIAGAYDHLVGAGRIKVVVTVCDPLAAAVIVDVDVWTGGN